MGTNDLHNYTKISRLLGNLLSKCWVLDLGIRVNVRIFFLLEEVAFFVGGYFTPLAVNKVVGLGVFAR